MAIKTLYLLNTAAATPNWNGSIQDGGTAPTGANAAFGWGPAKTAVTTPYFQGRIGATATVTTASASSYISGASAPLVGTGNSVTTASDSFVSPTPYTGVFASGNWTFNFGFRETTAGVTGHVNFRVWAGTNPNGTGARSLAAIQTGSTITLSSSTTTYTSTATWAAPQITLNNEYLFIQVEWQETTAGTANNNNAFFYQSGSTIVTTDFQATITGTLGATDIIDVSSMAGRGNAFGPLASTEAFDVAAFAGGPDTAQFAGGPVIGVVLDATEEGDTAQFVGGVYGTGVLDVTDQPDVVTIQGAVHSHNSVSGVPGVIPEVPYDRYTYEINSRVAASGSGGRSMGSGSDDRVVGGSNGGRVVAVPPLRRAA
jgi:hypothetical protein